MSNACVSVRHQIFTPIETLFVHPFNKKALHMSNGRPDPHRDADASHKSC